MKEGRREDIERGEEESIEKRRGEEEKNSKRGTEGERKWSEEGRGSLLSILIATTAVVNVVTSSSPPSSLASLPTFNLLCVKVIADLSGCEATHNE